MKHPKDYLKESHTVPLPVETDRIKELIFLGTGTSSCIPNIRCLAVNNNAVECVTCNSALRDPGSKNKRRNTSIAIRLSSSTNIDKIVVVDCGRTFYEAVLDWLILYTDDLPKLCIEGLIITHGHADAILGLDDLRHFTSRQILQDSVSVYCDEDSFQVIQATFPYLVDNSKATGGGSISQIQFNLIKDDYLTLDSFRVERIKVQHGYLNNGDPFYSNGFIFEGIAYISDVSHVSEKVLERLKDIPVIIVDCLLIDRVYQSHYSLPQVIDFLKLVQPRYAYLTGMAHDWEQTEGSIMLQKLQHDIPELNNTQINLSFDGLRLKFNPKEPSA